MQELKKLEGRVQFELLLAVHCMVFDIKLRLEELAPTRSMSSNLITMRVHTLLVNLKGACNLHRQLLCEMSSANASSDKTRVRKRSKSILEARKKALRSASKVITSRLRFLILGSISELVVLLEELWKIRSFGMYARSAYLTSNILGLLTSRLMRDEVVEYGL